MRIRGDSACSLVYIPHIVSIPLMFIVITITAAITTIIVILETYP